MCSYGEQSNTQNRMKRASVINDISQRAGLQNGLQVQSICAYGGQLKEHIQCSWLIECVERYHLIQQLESVSVSFV